MDQSEQLSNAQLLRIAESIHDDPKKTIPEYLPEDDRRAVKELLDVLYAKDKAVKTYWMQMHYLDLKKAAGEKAIEADRRRLEMRKQYLDAKSYVIGKRNLEAALLRLNNSIGTSADVFQSNLKSATIVLGDDLFAAFKKRRSRGVGQWIEARVWRDYGSDAAFDAPSGDKLQPVRDFLDKAQSPNKLRAFNVGDMCLAIAKSKLDELGGGTQALAAIWADEMEKSQKYVLRQANRAKGWLGSSTKEYYAAKREADEQLERTKLAGKWYIVASVGDLLIQLGSSLMNA